MINPVRQKVGHRSRQQGFTLTELLVVMVILALLASLVVPDLFGKLSTAETKATRFQLSMIATALDDFRLDLRRYPTEQEGLKILWEKPAGAESWKGPYLKKEIKGDPWGHAYMYKVPGPSGKPYQLMSLGADGVAGGDGVNADLSVWD